jgi:O-antigen/teichoic acid export membrane protein
VSAPTRSVEQIVADVVRNERAEFGPRWSMRTLLIASAAAMAFLVLADRYLSAENFAVVQAAGPPFRVLLVLAVLVEGTLAAILLARHEESSYPSFVQGSATTTAAGGAILFGAGAVLILLYTNLLAKYWPESIGLVDWGLYVLLAGVGVFVAALAPAACSVLRFSGDES